MKKEEKSTLHTYKANFAISKELYQLFKFGCALNDSNASTELRKFIVEYTKNCNFQTDFDFGIFDDEGIFDDDRE